MSLWREGVFGLWGVLIKRGRTTVPMRTVFHKCNGVVWKPLCVKGVQWEVIYEGRCMPVISWLMSESSWSLDTMYREWTRLICVWHKVAVPAVWIASGSVMYIWEKCDLLVWAGNLCTLTPQVLLEFWVYDCYDFNSYSLEVPVGNISYGIYVIEKFPWDHAIS